MILFHALYSDLRAISGGGGIDHGSRKGIMQSLFYSGHVPAPARWITSQKRRESKWKEYGIAILL